MRYSQWNDLLFDYFFQEETNREVFLGIDKEALIDYVLDRGVFKEEYARVLESNPGRIIRIEDYIWNSFTQLFKKRDSFGKDVLFSVFYEHLKDSATPDKMPTVFPCLALFIMPLANHPEMDSRNFYDRLTRFLQDNHIIHKHESIGTPDLRQFTNPSLRLMWENLELWANSEGYRYSVKSNPLTGHKYVGPFMAESLLTATQRDKFKLIFYEAGLTPELDMPEKRIISILNAHHRVIGFPDETTWKKLFDRYQSIFLNEFIRQYNKWDGNTIVRLHENNRRLSRDCGINKKLYLCLSIFRGNYHFSFKARFTDAELGAEFLYTAPGEPEYKFSIANEGYASSSYVPYNLASIVSNGNGFQLREATNPRNRLAFQNEEFFLFERYYDFYTSSCKLKIGGKFFILVRNDCIQSYRPWLNDNDAQAITVNHSLSSKYSLFYIPEAKSSFGTHSVLSFETRITARLSNTFIVKKDSGSITIFSKLPAFFAIEGVNVAHDSVRAVIDDGFRKSNKDLVYDEDSQLWKLPVITNTMQLSGCFQLYCNDHIISTIQYYFDDFNQLPEDGYQEISYDEWGNFTSEESMFCGLSVKKAIGLGFYLKDNMTRFGKPPVIIKRNYEFNDYLLYWLSSRSRTTRDELKEAIKVQIQTAIVSEGSEDKWSIRALIDDYCRLGYINYAYSSGQHIIAVNKPTFVLLPAKVNRNSFGGNTSSINCAEKYFKVLLTGARTPLYIDKLLKRAEGFSYKGSRLQIQIDERNSPLFPQRILIWSDSIEAIQEFATKYGIQFQRSIYANIMLESLGSVSDYEQHIEEVFSDFNETYEGFSDFSTINYRKLSELIHDARYINKDKVSETEFDYNGAIVTYFPGKYSEKTILWKDGKQYPVDKYWGYFMGMKLAGVTVVEIDHSDMTFKMPSFIKLPILYARALTMITGEIPEYSKGRRVYQLCDNPFANGLSPEAILKKLK